MERFLRFPEDQISEDAGIIPGLDGRKMSKSYGNVIPIFTERNNLSKLIKRIKTNSLEPGEPKEPSDCSLFKMLKEAFGSPQKSRTCVAATRRGLVEIEIKDVLIEIVDNKLTFSRGISQDNIRPSPSRNHLIKGAEKAEAAAPVLESVRGAVGIKGFI